MTVPIFSDPLPAQQRQVGALLWVGAVSRLTMADTPRASAGPASRVLIAAIFFTLLSVSLVWACFLPGEQTTGLNKICYYRCVNARS